MHLHGASDHARHQVLRSLWTALILGVTVALLIPASAVRAETEREATAALNGTKARDQWGLTQEAIAHAAEAKPAALERIVRSLIPRVGPVGPEAEVARERLVAEMTAHFRKVAETYAEELTPDKSSMPRKKSKIPFRVGPEDPVLPHTGRQGEALLILTGKTLPELWAMGLPRDPDLRGAEDAHVRNLRVIAQRLPLGDGKAQRLARDLLAEINAEHVRQSFAAAGITIDDLLDVNGTSPRAQWVRQQVGWLTEKLSYDDLRALRQLIADEVKAQAPASEPRLPPGPDDAEGEGPEVTAATAAPLFPGSTGTPPAVQGPNGDLSGSLGGRDCAPDGPHAPWRSASSAGCLPRGLTGGSAQPGCRLSNSSVSWSSLPGCELGVRGVPGGAAGCSWGGVSAGLGGAASRSSVTPCPKPSGGGGVPGLAALGGGSAVGCVPGPGLLGGGPSVLTSAAPCPQPGMRNVSSVTPLLSSSAASAVPAIDSVVGADLPEVSPPSGGPPEDRDEKQAAEEQAQQHQQDQADQQALVATTMAAHDQAVAEGAAYTEKRDREAAAAGSAAAESEPHRQAEEEEGNQPAPAPPPESTGPAPPPYREPEGQDSEDTSDTLAANEDGPVDTADLPDPDDGWVPSDAPPPPPLQLDLAPAADPRYAQGYTDTDIYREDHPDEFSTPDPPAAQL